MILQCCKSSALMSGGIQNFSWFGEVPVYSVLLNFAGEFHIPHSSNNIPVVLLTFYWMNEEWINLFCELWLLQKLSKHYVIEYWCNNYLVSWGVNLKSSLILFLPIKVFKWYYAWVKMFTANLKIELYYYLHLLQNSVATR